MRISLPAVLAFLCGFAATVVVVQHRVPALGALHLDGTHSPHHLRAKPQPPPAAAPRSGLLDKLRAELPAAARATPPPTGAAPSAQERREAERLEAERRAEAEVAAAREVAREAAARQSGGRGAPGARSGATDRRGAPQAAARLARGQEETRGAGRPRRKTSKAQAHVRRRPDGIGGRLLVQYPRNARYAPTTEARQVPHVRVRRRRLE